MRTENNFVSGASTRHTRTVRLTEEAPQVTDSMGVTVQPERIEYSWTDDGLANVVEVTGARILKDGSRGAWRTIVVLLSKDRHSYYAVAPQWIRDIVTPEP